MTPQNYSKDDLRVQRTRKLIQEALIELTIAKGFGAVTVRDITSYAKINRATFYRHYLDKFDLLDQYAQDVYELLDDSAEGDRAGEGLTRLFEHIQSNGRFYRVMLSQKGDPEFAEKIRRFIEKRISRSLPEGVLKDKRMADVYLNFVSAGSMRLVVWWLEQEMPYTPAELTVLSYKLSASSLEALTVSG